MVKNFKYRITIDNRGKITCGKKRDNSEIPQSLDYFDISDFPELVKWYGLKPSRLLIYFPTDTIEDFFNTAFNSWYTTSAGKVGKRRSCDGETCLHFIDEEINGEKYVAGEETECICKSLGEKDKHKCRYDCIFKAYVGNPITGKIENPCCYMFSTHSDNSADAVYSELDKIKILNSGSLKMIPFELSVKMHESAGNRKYPIISLRVWGLLPEIRDASKNFLGGLPAPFAPDAPALNAPAEPQAPALSAPVAPIEENPIGMTKEAPAEPPPDNFIEGLREHDNLLEEAKKIIGDGEGAVTSWCKATKKIKQNETLRNLPDEVLRVITNPKSGFMKMINKWFDLNNK